MSYANRVYAITAILTPAGLGAGVYGLVEGRPDLGWTLIALTIVGTLVLLETTRSDSRIQAFVDRVVRLYHQWGVHPALKVISVVATVALVMVALQGGKMTSAEWTQHVLMWTALSVVLIARHRTKK